jgi:GNAT superfamily N-acetyltransferase
MPTIAPPRSGHAVTVLGAAEGDEWAVRALFRDLHAFNAALEARFALEDGWERLLAEHLAAERAAGTGSTLLAWDEDGPVGLAMVAAHTDSPLYRHRRWAELTALHVVPRARGTGVADLLLAAARAWAEDRGFRELRLYVTTSNERARRFYDRSGFRPIQEIWTVDLGPAAETAAIAGAESLRAA